MNSALSLIAEAMRYDFIVRALIVGSFIAISCSFLGMFLVLKKWSLIGDGLAHVSFAAVAISLFFSASPLILTMPLVVISSFIILKLNEKARISGDAAIGLVSATAVSIGLLVSSAGKGFNVDLFSYLFGSILVIDESDVMVSILLSVCVIALVTIFYNSLFAVTYDEDFANISGIKSKFINYLIVILTAVTITVGIRIVGTMLISSMIIFPPVSTLQLGRSFKQTIIISALISLLCVICGVFLSYIINMPTGAVIVILNALVFIFLFILKRKIS
ncbi:MAG: metal ABC transporter permease [Spirochaetota bacterium]